MGEAKTGEEFITHEFDEAIAIQRSIVEAEKILSTKHPFAAAKRVVKEAHAQDDQRFLDPLEKLGEAHGATGELEDVAESMTELMEDDARERDQRAGRQRVLRGARGPGQPQAQADGLGRRDARHRARPGRRRSTQARDGHAAGAEGQLERPGRRARVVRGQDRNGHVVTEDDAPASAGDNGVGSVPPEDGAVKRPPADPAGQERVDEGKLMDVLPDEDGSVGDDRSDTGRGDGRPLERPR